MKRRLGAFVLIATMAASSHAATALDVQWVFRWGDREGSDPIASFLSPDFSAVLFRATCDRERHELVLEYFGDGAVPLSSKQGLSLIGRDTEMKLKTRLIGHRLEGRLPITPKLKHVLSGSYLDIDAPNEIGEPWPAGKAEELARVVNACG